MSVQATTINNYQAICDNCGRLFALQLGHACTPKPRSTWRVRGAS